MKNHVTMQSRTEQLSVALLALASMVTLLGGCGDGTPRDTAVTELAQEAASAPEAPGEAGTVVSASSSDAAAGQAAEASVPFSVGEVRDGVYENPFLGIAFSQPEDMQFADRTELAALSSLTSDALGDLTEIQKLLADGSVMTICYAAGAQDKLPFRSFNITVQREDSAQAGDAPTEEAIIDGAREKLGPLLAQQGFQDISNERATMAFLGKEVPCMILSATLEGVGTLYERAVCVRRGGYIVTYTVSVTGGEDTTGELLDSIWPLDS